jgi:hypothetical protein
LKVTPLGSAPDSLNAGVGDPVAVTVKFPAVPTVNVVLLALVIAAAPCKVYVAVAMGLLENPGAVAIAWTVVVAVTLKEEVNCWVVPEPGAGVLPSVVK